MSNYLPIVLATSGFEQYLRIANTGSREAAVSVALIDQDTGSGRIGSSRYLEAWRIEDDPR